ncbi:terminase large subunit domain-containing protein [Campylobacter jejuni]|nr:terminase family protein [Campylobacter jejuni]
MLSKEEIKYFQTHKNEITDELLETIRAQGKLGKAQALEILDLPKDSDNYYLDAYNTRISYNGSRGLKKAYTKLNLSPIHISELEKCANDPLYFLRNYVRMTTPKGFDFVDSRPYQDEFIQLLSDDSIENVISMQPRQSSKSTTTSVKLAHLYCFKKDLTIGIVAYSGNSAREFLDKTKKILIGLPIWMQPGTVTWNKGSIECENNIKILTDVPSSDSFRGYGCNIIVVDECAYLDPAGWIDFTDGVLPSQAGLAFKKLVILSTPKGKNHFYDIWQGAGDTLDTSVNGFVRHRVDWRLVPRFKSDGTKYDPEEFKQQQIKTGGLVVWNSAYECKFEGSAMTLIPSEILDTYKPQEPIEVDNIKDSKILIYEEPIPGHKYVMGVDTAKEGADFTGVQIFDTTDLNFRQVASAKLKIDYMLLPELLNEYGLRFNQALIIVENNEGSGQVVADILKRDYEYENLYYDVNKQKQRLKYPGFRTTKLSRDVILQTVSTLAQANKLLLVDKETIKEFGVFTLNDNGKYQAAVGYHDDLVMSCCLCFGIFTNVKNFEDMKEIVDSLKSSEGKSFEYLTFGAFADGLGTEPDSNTDNKDLNHSNLEYY